LRLPEREAVPEITAISIAVIAAVLIAPLLEFGWNFFKAPVRILTDENIFLREEIEGLKEKLSDDGGIRQRLTVFRTEGVELRNSSQQFCDYHPLNNAMGNQIVLWIEETLKWQRKVIEVLKQHDQSDAEWFRVLDTVPAPRTAYPILDINNNKGFQKAFREHDYRLVRIEELIQKY